MLRYNRPRVPLIIVLSEQVTQPQYGSNQGFVSTGPCCKLAKNWTVGKHQLMALKVIVKYCGVRSDARRAFVTG